MKYIKVAQYLPPYSIYIYFEDFINQLKIKFRIDQIRTLWYKAYANDLVFVTKNIHLVYFRVSIK